MFDLIFWYLCKNSLKKEYDFGVFDFCDVDFGVIMTGDSMDDKEGETFMATRDLIDDKAIEPYLIM